MANPWDNDPIVQPAQQMGRTIYQQQAPQPTPQTPAQRRKDEAQAVIAEREVNKPVLTEGQKAVDSEFAKDYVAYMAGGGFADTRKQLEQLRGVTTALKSGKNLTGPILGHVPDIIKSWTNPESISTQEAVAEVVQRSLRQVLGAQFTENEGVRLIARAYNPALPEVENRKRVARLRIQLTRAAQAKENAARYFEKNGTLSGWKGKLPSMNDFDPEKSPAQLQQQKKKPQAIQFLGFEQ